MNFIKLFLLLLLPIFVVSQSIEAKKNIDSLYREDQFYLTTSYNNLQKFPRGLSQNKLSPGISFGFLRDMPINKSRNKAIAIGFGYAFSQYNYNLYTYLDSDQSRVYEVLSSDIYYNKNRLSLHSIEFPIEYRWRSSNAESHKFWRVYTGFKIGYLFADKYHFVNDVQNFTLKNNPDLNKLNYGFYLSTGWNTWNIYGYYGLNSVFKNVALNGSNLNMNTVNVGLQFYIL